MVFSSVYICPRRGLATLAPPEPIFLARGAQVARELGLDRLFLPVLEEALLGTSRQTTKFLDGLIQVLDRLEGSGLTVFLIAPAQRLAGMDWVAPYLAKAREEPDAEWVFVDGRARRLAPFDWWKDPALVQKRIRLFRELVCALGGHPGLKGWVLMDRVLEWTRPGLQTADLLLKSFVAEIRHRQDGTEIFLSLDWKELLKPEMAQGLAKQVDGVRLIGFDQFPDFWDFPQGASPLAFGFYAASLARWLLARPIEIELAPGLLTRGWEFERGIEELSNLKEHGLNGMVWFNFADPAPEHLDLPPWSLSEELRGSGLLDENLEPKKGLEAWIRHLHSLFPKTDPLDFIDLGPSDYLSNPQQHFSRLWDRFLE